MIDIATILAAAVKHRASDIHINVGMPPVIRRNTELTDMDLSAVSHTAAKGMIVPIVAVARFQQF